MAVDPSVFTPAAGTGGAAFEAIFREHAGDILADRVKLTPYDGKDGRGFWGEIPESDIKVSCCVRPHSRMDTPEGQQSVAEGLIGCFVETFPYGAHRDCDPFLALAPPAPALSATPERAAGGGGLPDLRALAQAVVDSAGPRMIPVRRSVDANALDALATRLAQPRPAAAGEGDLHTAVLAYRTARRALDALDPEETLDDPGGEAHAAALRKASERVDHAWRGVEAALGGAEIDDAPGRVDAGAVREALHSADDALAGASAALRCLASTGMSDTQAIITGARDQIRAALDVALDRAGEGSALGSEAAPPYTSTEPAP